MILVACKTDLRDKAMAAGTYNADKFVDRSMVSLGSAFCMITIRFSNHLEDSRS